MKALQDRHVQRQLVDFFLAEEITDGLCRGYPKRVAAKLARHGVQKSDSAVYSRAQRVIKGETPLQPLANFTGKPTPRHGKDMNYAGIWTILDFYIPKKTDRHYIGLAANQLDVIRHQIGGVSVVCERDPSYAEKLRLLAIQLSNDVGTVVVFHDDIFDYMRTTVEEWGDQILFNIFDLDLMCHLPDKSGLKSWVDMIYRSSRRGTVVLHITAVCGRKEKGIRFTEAKHQQRVGFLRRALEDVGFHEVGFSAWPYADNATPMRALRFVLNK